MPNYCSTADDRLTRILSLGPAERQSKISQQVKVVGLKAIRVSERSSVALYSGRTVRNARNGGRAA